MPACNTHEASRIVFAPEDTLYGAMTDLDRVRTWLLPEGEQICIETFDLRPGGRFRVSFGSSGECPVQAINGRFVDIVRDQQIVQIVELESPVRGFTGAIRIIWSLEDVPEGTCLRLVARDTPPGLDAEWLTRQFEATLDRLALLVERMPSASIIYSEAGAQPC
ncbi:SRPBCC domain-containing protein [Hyphomonas jannaschiana]|uniref:SRPBCC domain-containing protein n=1 Tax=Hyphomonas jannaschiana TaxID=86 RepID=UPI0035C6F302